MKTRWQVSAVSAVAAVICYVALAFLSYLQYPIAFSRFRLAQRPWQSPSQSRWRMELQLGLLAAKVHVIFLGFFMTFSATVLLRRSVSVRWPAYLGFLSAAVNFVYGALLHSVFAAEWVSIGMFVAYLLIVALTYRGSPAPQVSPTLADG